jgi:hypothetical protein
MTNQSRVGELVRVTRIGSCATVSLLADNRSDGCRLDELVELDALDGATVVLSMT